MQYASTVDDKKQRVTLQLRGNLPADVLIEAMTHLTNQIFHYPGFDILVDLSRAFVPLNFHDLLYLRALLLAFEDEVHEFNMAVIVDDREDFPPYSRLDLLTRSHHVRVQAFTNGFDADLWLSQHHHQKTA